MYTGSSSYSFDWGEIIRWGEETEKTPFFNSFLHKIRSSLELLMRMALDQSWTESNIIFICRELRGSTLANYAIKADIRAHRKAEKMNKSDVINNKLFEKQINNERHVTRLNIENVQMRYARKLHQLKLDQMRFEAESRAATAKTSDGESGRMPRHTWISSSNKIGNAQLRNIIRSSTSHSGKQKEEVEEVTPSRAKTAGSSKKWGIRNANIDLVGEKEKEMAEIWNFFNGDFQYEKLSHPLIAKVSFVYRKPR